MAMRISAVKLSRMFVITTGMRFRNIGLARVLRIWKFQFINFLSTCLGNIYWRDFDLRKFNLFMCYLEV